LVISAHKSVAVLGVIDRADEMHAILDAETTATMDWLDGWFQSRGGRRSRAQTRTATAGLIDAVSRHATSRAGDPSPHDHVLVANVVEMVDRQGGHKALDSAALRDTTEAATMVGRLHSAWKAVQLGYKIAPDDGPSGNLRHWRVIGIPREVCEQFSKRADDIGAHLDATGQDGYRARNVAARATRSIKRHTGTDELMTTWRAELDDLGWPLERLSDRLSSSRQSDPELPFPLSARELDTLAAEILDIDGALLRRHKVFTRTHLVSAVAPLLYGRDPDELRRLVDHITSSREVVPLVGVTGAREQSYTTTDVLTAEATIADTIETLADRTGPQLDPIRISDAIADSDRQRQRQLTEGQRQAVERLCGSGSCVSVVVGIAGSGKTTALHCATRALEDAGYRVLGSSTSGQAARTLATEAEVESRTFASLLWRLDRGDETLDPRTVVIVDEAGMADDQNLARLALAVDRAGGALVLVGDPRQLASVGPGGALAALLERRRDLVVTLDVNVRQSDPAERTALAELRDGSVPDAVAWYAQAGRIHHQPTRIDTLVAAADTWAADAALGHDTALLTWRRADVADLNRLARHHWRRLGRLVGSDHDVDGRSYAVGDRLVAVAPNHDAGIVTSEALAVLAVNRSSLVVATDDKRVVSLEGQAIDAGHLDYGYALTIYRSQGATYDRAHVIAAGGGRELAYVALSRARDRTTIHVTADDLAQAVDDLQADWGVDQHQRWITHTPARPGLQAEPRSTEWGRPGTDTATELRRRIAGLERELAHLDAGSGSDQGAAAREHSDIRQRLDRSLRQVLEPRSQRLAWATDSPDQRWRQLGEPYADDLRGHLEDALRDLRRHDADVVALRPTHPEDVPLTWSTDDDHGVSL
jgi:conjugative relaxase-like TrwC/TraI family protein